jgi:hypothetical protein
MRLYADDDVRRVNAVWLGPRGWTFPFAARYLAWGLWFAIFLGILAFEAVTPLDVSYVPVWEGCIAVLASTALMMLVDHDNPISAVLRDFRTELTGPRDHNPLTRYRPRPERVRVRETPHA